MMPTMACRPLYIGSKSIGDRCDLGSIFVFFGNRHFNEKEMDRCFPHLARSQTKQTHSGVCLQTLSPHPPDTEGDGQVTSASGVALTVYTADCLPILLFDPDTGQIASLHAGWRGLTRNIVASTLSHFQKKSTSRLLAWIGPHIQTDSFEVGCEVGSSLASAAPTARVTFPHPNDPSKNLVDLGKLATSQMTSLGVLEQNIWSHPVDTFKDPNYYSFRRDRVGGRLLSFIARLE